MPKVKDGLKVEVKEETAEDVRTIVVTINAPAEYFALTDLLRKRCAIGALEAPLRQTVRQTIQDYLTSAEELIDGVAKAGNGFKPRAAKARKERAQEPGDGADNTGESESQSATQ